MNQSTVDLVLHPIRIRILMALSERELTPGQLSQILADIPQATLYRHIKRLVNGGVLRVVGENPVRGTVEKVYALNADYANLQQEELAKLDNDTHMQLFIGFVASLLDDFARYLEGSEQVDLAADGVGYSKAVLYLNQTEKAELSQDIYRAIKPYLEKSPSPERQAHIFSTVMMPDLSAEENTDH